MPSLPFSSPMVPLGIGGLDLHRPANLIEPSDYSRLTNCLRQLEGSLTIRPGQTQVFSTVAGQDVHSLVRLSNVPTGGYGRIAGVGTGIYWGTTGALALVSSGHSGDPLTMVDLRPPLSGDAWAYVGDRTKMQKIRVRDGLALPIGLPKPPSTGGRFRIDEFARTPDGSISTTDRARFVGVGFDITAGGTGDPSFSVLQAEKTTTIDMCEVAGWTNNTGTGGGAPTNTTDPTIKKQGTNSLKLTTNAGASAYYNFWGKANALNLSIFSDGFTMAADEDVIHLWVRCDRPDILTELRVYFVCSTPFSATTIPGTSDTNNTDAFLKAIRPADFTELYEASIATLPAASAYNATAQTLGRLGKISDDRSGLVALIKDTTEAIRATSLTLSPGRAQWTELGAVGVPLRRGDFRRIGSDLARGWATITGIIILASVRTGTNLNVWLDDIYMRGGYGPDTSPIGATRYDYRYHHYDPRVGVKGNPIDVVVDRFAIDAIRQAVILTPQAYGDAAMRQRFYRRGGSLTLNWYFLGENTSDGGVFLDTLADDEIGTSSLLEIDNDQPVTTIAADGSTIRSQPLPAIWGPVVDLLMGCGDPYQPGVLFWCKPGQYDHWPSANTREVCGPAEELMNGCVFLGQAYVFSRARIFPVYVNLSTTEKVNAVPGACKHGLAARWGLAVGADGIYFVANDGIYVTTGGPETSITQDKLDPLFNGESMNGYLPVDFTVPNAIRLQMHGNELWFLYRDTGGTNRVLVYDVQHRYWRPYTFGRELSTVHSEIGVVGAPSLLMGARGTGLGYTHTGFTDAGVAIPYTMRTAASGLGSLRAEKEIGDIVLELDRQGQSITVTPYANDDATALQAQTINTLAGRQRYYLDPIDAAGNAGPYYARTFSLELSGSSSGAPPVFYMAGVSAIVMPDDTTLRVTDWDDAGSPSDKLVKGVVLDVDTGGVAKSVQIEGDGSLKTTITPQATGRQSLEFSWTEFKARLLRLRPIGGTTWKLFGYRWVFDEEPLSLTRWESQELTLGDSPGGRSLLYANIAISSSAAVTLQVTVHQYDGTTTVLAPAALPNTGGVKRLVFVPFVANKGVLFKWVFTSAAAFHLYREESAVAVQPWGGELTTLRPFGNDDLDLVRGMVNAESVAARPGGGQ